MSTATININANLLTTNKVSNVDNKIETTKTFNNIMQEQIRQIAEPKRSDYSSKEDFYLADNNYVQTLLENPYALPDTGVEGYQLTRPTEGVSRSTDVYDRKIDDNMIKYLGRNGEVVWQVFAPNLNWHQTNDASEDQAVGDAYSRNTSRFSAETVFKRGEQAEDSQPILNGVAYDGGKEYEKFQTDLYYHYAKMVAKINSESDKD